MAAEGSWFGAAIGTVITPLKDLFFKHAMYCFNPGKYVEDHKRDTMTLIGRQTGIQGEINTGEPNGLIATPDADYWVKRANQAISEEATNREQYENRGRFFCCGSLNCCANYKIAKRAVKARREVSSCLDSIPSNATVRKPPPPVQYKSIESPELPGHESILQTACESINNQVGIIGIWGPDGVGNTHLLKKINNSFVGPEPPYFVIFVTVSSEFSVQNMQDQIIQRLEIRKDDVAANPATNISELLRTRDFLLLVDGLYEKLDLEAVGIPHPLGIIEGQFKRKVVITSQSKTVCNQMFVNEYIEVPGLGETEALKLFARNVGREDIYSDSHIRGLAHDLVEELKGVPSDLIHFGKQMVGKSDPGEWEDVIRSVRKSNLQKKDPTLASRTLGNLEEATKNLLSRSTDVRHRIEAAERGCMAYTSVVDIWLENVDTISSDVQIICQGYELNKDVTVEAIEKIHVVQECLRDCPNNDNIAFKPVPPPSQEMPGPSMSSQNDNLQKALQFIRGGHVGMIGIWGQGGVGKTYLLRSINNSIAAAGGMPFHVIFVTASRQCSVEKIQKDILEKLGMGTDSNVESQRQMIFNFLKSRSFLVLLDDLWEQIDLRAVGVPYPLGFVNQLKRKVVLTTRLRNICGEMEVREELHVACLEEDDAWQLFKEKVGQKTLTSDPRIIVLARELVNELKGLPLALEVIGRSMYGKGPIHWEHAIKHMKFSRYSNMETVLNQLKFSYDSLRKQTLRDCFLTCALWPEDWKIRKSDLAQCWMGLGLVDEDDIESSYTKAYILIDDLRDASLLESLGNQHGSVRVHDLMRDMALWISCGCSENDDKWFVRARVGKDKKLSIPWSKAEYVSLMRNQIQEFPPPDFNPCYVKLRMLCLQSNSVFSIAQTIENFTSLTYLDLSGNFIKNISDELCSLVNLEHLNLSHNRLIQLPHCFRNLIKLKFLYLQNSGIKAIPEGLILNLKALQVIDLRTRQLFDAGDPGNCNPAVFCELGTLAHLKAASIVAAGFAEYESLSGAANLPIRSLTLAGRTGRPRFSLSGLSSLGFVERTLHELRIVGSTVEEIIAGHELAQPDYHFPTLNKIILHMLKNLKEITWTGGSPTSVFPRLTCLHVYTCSKLEHLSWVIYLPCLEQLGISACTSMKQAFVEPIHPGTFPCLKHLVLSHNSRLVAICDMDVTFPSLQQLVIHDCPALARLPFQMRSLPPKLQELRFDEIERWEKLEWEEGVKSSLQPTLKLGDLEDVGMVPYRGWLRYQVELLSGFT